jgi:hypothetical protein
MWLDQRAWRVCQHQDLEVRLSNLGIDDGAVEDKIQIAMQQAQTRIGTSAFQAHTSKAQILVSGKEPGVGNSFGKLLLEVRLKVGPGLTLLLLQAARQRQGVQGADRHALTINGVEGADGISGDDETGGPALHAFKMAQMILRSAKSSNGRQWS